MPVTVSVAGLRKRFPEFTAERKPDSNVEYAIEEAQIVAGKLSAEAQLYCAAHLLTIEQEKVVDEIGNPVPDGGSGVVVGERIGPRTVSYMTAEGRQFYERTYYGRMFLELQHRSARRKLPMVIG